MSSLNDIFSIQVFFIVLRETLELAIILSVLLAYVDQTVNKPQKSNGDYDSLHQDPGPYPGKEMLLLKKESRRLKFSIWAGGILGIVVCCIVGAIILLLFYVVGSDLWSITEHYWEGFFSILASVIISVMGIKILRVTKMQKKWKQKLGMAMGDLQLRVPHAAGKKKNAIFFLPFVTTLREGLEAIVFVGGIGINEDTTVVSIINAALSAIAIGTAVGVAMYRTGHTLSIQVFLVVSACFLYLVAAGLFSKGVWSLELQHFINSCGGQDVSESGDGPGSYDVYRSAWHVNCCNGERAEDGMFWMIFTAILGWTNSATFGSVISYNIYWMAIVSIFASLTYEERFGCLPFFPLSWQKSRIEKRLRSENPYEPRGSMDSLNSRTELTN